MALYVPLCLVTNTFDIGENDLRGLRGLKCTPQLVSRRGGHIHKGDAQVGQIDLHLALQVEEGKDQHSSHHCKYKHSVILMCSNFLMSIKTSQELRMLSSVTINCQVRMIV